MRIWKLIYCLIGLAAQGACAGPDEQSQSLEVTDSLVLELPDTLNLSPNAPLPQMSVGPDGSIFVAGFVESWKWAEFDREGNLVRAPGMRWTGGGPGEYRSIRGVIPVAGDTLLVFDGGSRTVRVTRSGEELGRMQPSLRPNAWLWHDGHLWVAGSLGSGETPPILRFDSAGSLIETIDVSTTEPSSLYLARFYDGLWAFEYPRGPWRQFWPSGRDSIWTSEPMEGTWRAFPSPLEDGGFVQHAYYPDVDEHWITVVGAEREIILRQRREPEEVLSFMPGGRTLRVRFDDFDVARSVWVATLLWR
jgi:hypothetical protein